MAETPAPLHPSMPMDPDRARRHTASAVLARIDQDTRHHLSQAATDDADPTARLGALDREWDIDRAIEAEAAAVGLAGLALGVLADRRFLIIPGLVGLSVLWFAATGRYPMLPLLRAIGLRTSREILRERYALKALRGDFQDLSPRTPSATP